MVKGKKSLAVAPPKRAEENAIWLFFGNDEECVARSAVQLVDSLVPRELRDTELETVDGRAENAEEAVAAIRRVRSGLETVGLFSASRLVWLRDATFFQDNRVGRSSAVKAEVAALADLIKSGFCPGNRLLVTALSVDRRSAFFKACEVYGDVREFEIPDRPREQEEYVCERIREIATGLGLDLTHAAVAALYGKIGPDTRRLAVELEKLRCYKGEEHRVTDEDVRRIISAAREAAAWDLADAVGDRNLERSLETLRQLLFQGEEEFLLIMGLQSRISELLIIRTALDQGWMEVGGSDAWPRAAWRGAGPAEAVFGDLPEKMQPAQMNPFRAGRLAIQARRYKRAELLEAQRILLETHEAMVRTPTPPDLLLEMALVKIISK